MKTGSDIPTADSIPSDSDMLDFLGSQKSDPFWLWKMSCHGGCVYLDKNASSGFETPREAIADYMEKQEAIKDRLAENETR